MNLSSKLALAKLCRILGAAGPGGDVEEQSAPATPVGTAKVLDANKDHCRVSGCVQNVRGRDAQVFRGYLWTTACLSISKPQSDGARETLQAGM